MRTHKDQLRMERLYASGALKGHGVNWRRIATEAPLWAALMGVLWLLWMVAP